MRRTEGAQAVGREQNQNSVLSPPMSSTLLFFPTLSPIPLSGGWWVNTLWCLATCQAKPPCSVNQKVTIGYGVWRTCHFMAWDGYRTFFFFFFFFLWCVDKISLALESTSWVKIWVSTLDDLAGKSSWQFCKTDSGYWLSWQEMILSPLGHWTPFDLGHSGAKVAVIKW